MQKAREISHMHNGDVATWFEINQGKKYVKKALAVLDRDMANETDGEYTSFIDYLQAHAGDDHAMFTQKDLRKIERGTLTFEIKDGKLYDVERRRVVKLKNKDSGETKTIPKSRWDKLRREHGKENVERYYTVVDSGFLNENGEIE